MNRVWARLLACSVLIAFCSGSLHAEGARIGFDSIEQVIRDALAFGLAWQKDRGWVCVSR
jgi:hypothetical protein